jgi:DegV family protein with EDD domain
VTVIDSRSASIGLGLIVRRAAEAVEHGAGKDAVMHLVRRLVPRTRIHFAVRSLDGLVRSGRVSKVKGLAAGLLGLKPLLRLGADTGGKPVQGATVFGVKGGRKKILRILHAELDAALPVEFAIAHANAYEDALWFKERITEEFTLAREPFVVEATSVLAAHIGEGTVGIAYILPGDDD